MVKTIHHSGWLALLCLITGASLALAFAPINFILFSFLAPAALYFALQQVNTRTAVWRGLCFGVGFFSVGTSWIYISIHVYGYASIPLSILLTACFVLILAVFFPLQAWLYSRWLRQSHYLLDAFAFAASWALCEILRTVVLTGFPWLLLGNSQINSPLVSFAPIVGVYGVTLLVALIGALFVQFLQKPASFYRNLLFIFLIFLVGFSLSFIHWATPVGNPLSVNLVQGNISQSIKWDQRYLDYSLARYKQLTEQNKMAQLVIWPEGAVADIYQNQSKFFDSLQPFLTQHNMTLMAGVILSNIDNSQYYNGMVKLNNNTQFYAKRHLVPFGEYVPFSQWLGSIMRFLDIPMSNFAPGPSDQTLFSVNNLLIAPFLCYEIAYPGLVLSSLPEANILLTASDDSWFGDSWAAAQQLQIAQMRSIEVAREQLVVANTGYTGIIDERGRITAMLPRDTIGALNGHVQGLQGATPLVYASGIEMILLLGLLGWLIWRNLPKKTR